jgi:cytochrome oxidase Cu insertion factor (SCO1/SenC/PrrC family)
MLRWLATLLLVGLFALNLWMPSSPLGRRGNERTVRAHVPALAARVGQPLPDLAFQDLDGRVVRTADLLGHPLLLVFERSVDW